jgi:Spy/CpxP family protein refolding chaperone
MRRTTFSAIVLAVPAILACGGSEDSPTGLEGVRPVQAEAEITLTGNRIAASEIGAVGLAFDLEEGQRQAIADAIARARAALADLRARWRAGEIGAEATVAEARAIRMALDAEIAAVLTPEQLAEIEARRAAFHPGLELTDEQRTAIQSIVDDWRVLVLETLRGLREEELTLREAGQALLEGARARRAAVCEVLDAEQRTLLGCAAPAAG